MNFSWFKVAHQVGIGRAAVRLVATDGTGRLDMCALSEMLKSDRRSDRCPVMIVATAGTTNAGVIDPLGPWAKAMGLWLHVDAAWGGAVVASDRYRGLLASIEHADSITVDAHKWFAATMACSMFLTRWPSALRSTFSVSTGYMPSSHADDPYMTSVQRLRRFLGLRLFLSLAVACWRGYAEHVEHTLSLGEPVKQRLTGHGWRVVNQSPLGVVCVGPPMAKDARAIVDYVLASGKAWVLIAAFEGRDVIRVCVTSEETTDQDINELVNCLLQAFACLSERAGR